MIGPDPDRPNSARMYDWFLGGAHNFAVDREACRALSERFPTVGLSARANRSFLGRVVRYCLDAGVRQFLDLGSGIPTVGNVHEIAHAVDPSIRVAYVDHEPIAVAASAELLAGVEHASITQADLRDTDAVLAAPGVAGLLDLSAPVAVLAVSSASYVLEDDDLTGIIAAYRAVMVPGSALALSHSSDDLDDPDAAAGAQVVTDVMRKSATPAVMRTRAELLAALEGFDLVPPGLVDVTRWRPDSGPRPDGLTVMYGAVGHPRTTP